MGYALMGENNKIDPTKIKPYDSNRECFWYIEVSDVYFYLFLFFASWFCLGGFVVVPPCLFHSYVDQAKTLQKRQQ